MTRASASEFNAASATSSVAQRALLRQSRSRGPITKTDKGRARRLWVPDDLVFTSSTGTPFEPRNANRVFTDLLKTAGLRPLGSTTCGTRVPRCCSLKGTSGGDGNPRPFRYRRHDEHLRVRDAAGAT